MVHAEDPIGADVAGHRPRLLGRGVDVHVGVVGADAEDREVARPDVAEALVVGGVAAEEDAAAVERLDHVGVVAAVVVVERAGAPVGDLVRGELQRADVDRLAPPQLVHLAEARGR